MQKKKKSWLRTIAPPITVLFLICFIGCGKKSFENPIDPNNDDYEKPKIVYLSLLDSTSLQTDTVTISWQANYPGLCEYAYRFQATEAWSAWVMDTSLLDRVADGNYTFQLSIRYKGQTDTTMVAAHFNVTTLTESAVYLYPLRRTVTTTSPSTSFSICCNKLDTCNAMEIVVRGVTINDVSLVDSTATSSFAFTSDSVITVGIGPSDKPICNTMPFLTINVTPPSVNDTTDVIIYAPLAKYVDATSQKIVSIYQNKGGFIIKK